MAGGRPLCLSCFSSSILLLLYLCHPGVLSSRTIYKKVGDSVEISSELPTEGVNIAKWKYNDIIVAERDRRNKHIFGNRLNFNTTSLSITLKNLTLQDSGNFSFVSEQNKSQRKTVIITLQVYESITEDPVLKITHISSDSNQSCTVLVNCSLKSTNNVRYKLMVGNQIYDGSSLQHSIRKQGDGQRITCTAFNYVSNRTRTKNVMCQDDSTKEVSHDRLKLLVIVVIVAACGGLLLIILVVVVVCCCRQKREGSNSTELTVYADVTDHHINTRKASNSVYDTIQDSSPTPSPSAPTVYDKVDFNRCLKPAEEKEVL